MKNSLAKPSRKRIGALTVEFALSAPVLFLFTFSGVEFARVNMIRNSIENAAYEGARTGIIPGATAADCEAAAQDVLDAIQLAQSTITVAPAVIQPDSPTVSVTIGVPITTANGYITPKFYLGTTMTTSITLPRESFRNEP